MRIRADHSRAGGAGGAAWVAALAAIALAAAGVAIDADPDVTQPSLFLAFMAASVAGTLVGLVATYDPGRSLWGHAAVVATAAFVWRVSYFPHLVFGGFVAALAEASIGAIGLPAAPIYPIFLPAIAALHAGSLIALGKAFPRRSGTPEPGLRGRLTNPPRALVAALAAPAIVVATLVSISTPADVTLAPDAPWEAPRALPAAGEPGGNPYIGGVFDHERPIPPRVLRFAAAMTYVLIPHSLWAKDVKGTLSDLTHAYPHASTRQRLDEHYLAYLVAHRHLGGGSP